MTEEEGVQILTRLGLTISQAKVYLALLELEKATGKTISKHSEVARQETYRVLAELEEKGLVEKIIAVPTEFKAIPIEDFVSSLIERRKKEISETEKEATILLQKLKEKNSNSLQEDETQLSLVSERVAVRRKEKTLEAIERSFDVVSSFRDPHSVLFIDVEEMAEALQRGVEIRVIIDKPDEEKLLSDITKHLKQHSNFKIKYLLKAPEALISIYDKKEAWVCTCTHPVLEECATLRTNNPCLLAILQDCFEMMWLRAMESNTE
jgi:sugar-specific transcriptional regulator TrmB